MLVISGASSWLCFVRRRRVESCETRDRCVSSTRVSCVNATRSSSGSRLATTRAMRSASACALQSVARRFCEPTSKYRGSRLATMRRQIAAAASPRSAGSSGRAGSAVGWVTIDKLASDCRGMARSSIGSERNGRARTGGNEAFDFRTSPSPARDRGGVSTYPCSGRLNEFLHVSRHLSAGVARSASRILAPTSCCRGFSWRGTGRLILTRG